MLVKYKCEQKQSAYGVFLKSVKILNERMLSI